MLLALAAAALMGAPGDLQVTNIEAGALVRYPLVILRGTTTGSQVAAGLTWKSVHRFPVANGRFVALVELKPGTNMVLMNSGPEVLKLRLDYRPMTTHYRVACVYVGPSDEPTNYDAPPGVRSDQYGEKLDTALKLLQAVTAEAMNDAGFGRETFPLEFKSNGMVDVHVLRNPRIGADLRAMGGQDLWNSFDQWLPGQFPTDTTKLCTVMSFSRYDGALGKVLGGCSLGGGQLALFGGQNMAAWPTTCAEIPTAFTDAKPIDTRFQLDDSGGRGTEWALASTTLGDMLHEMGHAFGLADVTDPESFMSSGFEQLNRNLCVFEPSCKAHGGPQVLRVDDMIHLDPDSAKTLSASPWFQPD